MPRPRKHGVRLQSQTFKTTERHQFAIRLVANQQGKSQSTVQEEMIERMANELTLSRRWDDLWDEEESVRILNCFALPEYRASEKATRMKGRALTEKQVRAFVIAHAPFFYADKARTTPKRKFAVVLWPHVEELAQAWHENRDEDYYIAAKQMTAILKKAKLEPPEFG